MDFWKRTFVSTAGQIISEQAAISSIFTSILRHGFPAIGLAGTSGFSPYLRLLKLAKPLSNFKDLAIPYCFIACLAKLANVNGNILQEERDFVDALLKKEWQLSDEDCFQLKEVFDAASKDDVPIDSYIELYAELIQYSYNESMNFVTSLISFAYIDNEFCGSERRAIEVAIKILRLPVLTLDSILLNEKVDKEINTYESVCYGSGLFINTRGYVVTNNHVIDQCGLVKIRSNLDFYNAKLITKNIDYDFALLKVDAANQSMKFAATSARAGQSIFTLGYPEPDLQGFFPKITKGIVSSLAGSKDNVNYMQIDAAIQPGNSGCPVMDCASGAVIGIASKGVPRLDKVNYALKTDVIRMLLESVGQLSDTLEYTDDKPEELPEIIERVGPSVVQIFACN
jgi:hypothetical protein